jgi:hypothetical protein
VGVKRRRCFHIRCNLVRRVCGMIVPVDMLGATMSMHMNVARENGYLAC